MFYKRMLKKIRENSSVKIIRASRESSIKLVWESLFQLEKYIEALVEHLDINGEDRIKALEIKVENMRKTIESLSKKKKKNAWKSWK